MLLAGTSDKVNSSILCQVSKFRFFHLRPPRLSRLPITLLPSRGGVCVRLLSVPPCPCKECSVISAVPRSVRAADQLSGKCATNLLPYPSQRRSSNIIIRRKRITNQPNIITLIILQHYYTTNNNHIKILQLHTI